MNDPILFLESVSTGYRKKEVLHGITLEVRRGEIVAVIGHNGAGKSTLLKAAFGLVPPWKGTVRFKGAPVGSMSPANLIRSGMAYVSQGSRVFTDLTVRDNLKVSCLACPDSDKDVVGVAVAVFPALGRRLRTKAGLLSGGERQMLAFARAILYKPRLLLLDEPSMGLAPPLVRQSFAHIDFVAKQSGAGVLLVEQKVREALSIADRVYVLRGGQIAYEGPASELRSDLSRLRAVFL